MSYLSLLDVIHGKAWRKNHSSSVLVGSSQVGATNAFVQDGPIFAFCGGAAIGQVANVFKNFYTASPCAVVQVLPM